MVSRPQLQRVQSNYTSGIYRLQVRWAVESDAASGWAWRPAPFEGNLLVSEMTKIFATDILVSGRCELPTLEESLVAHRFVLGELQPHFSRLLEQEVERCPVT